MIQQDSAETLALQALAWILQQDGLAGVFVGATGAEALDMRKRVQDTEFLAAVLDFLCMDDAWVIAFCEAAGLPNDAPGQARAALPGGELPHWT